MKQSILFLIFILIGCVQEEDLVNHGQAVVESYLVVGQVPVVKVSTLALFESSEGTQPIEGLDITIETNGVTYPLAAIDSGLYQNSDLVVEEDRDYNLLFTYNDRAVTALARALYKPINFQLSASSITVSGSGSGFPPTFPDPITMSWENPESNYYVVVVENIETDPTSIYDLGDDDDRPSFRFRNQPITGSTQEIGARQFQYYGQHRVILFHITPDYAALYNQTGNTSQNITTPPTNITNGLGIFTAVNSDTLFLQVK